MNTPGSATITAKGQCVRCHANYEMTIVIPPAPPKPLDANDMIASQPEPFVRCLACKEDGLLLTGDVFVPFS